MLKLLQKKLATKLDYILGFLYMYVCIFILTAIK